MGLVEDPVEGVDPEVRPAVGGRVQHGEGCGAAHVVNLSGRIDRVAVHVDDVIGAVAQNPGALDGDQLVVRPGRRGDGRMGGSIGARDQKWKVAEHACAPDRLRGAGDAREGWITHIAVRKWSLSGDAATASVQPGCLSTSPKGTEAPPARGCGAAVTTRRRQSRLIAMGVLASGGAGSSPSMFIDSTAAVTGDTRS